MTDFDDEFFVENFVNVNKTVEIILFITLFIPLIFAGLTFAGLWEIPHKDSISLFAFCLFAFLTCFICNKKKKAQIFVMYFGIFSSAIIVSIMGAFGLIKLLISYALVPMMSCLYYNKRLTRITNLINFILMIIVSYIGSANELIVTSGVVPRNLHFVRTIIGLTIESVFLFVITDALSKRSYKNISNLVRSKKQRDKAYKELQKRNGYITKINTELEVKNRELEEIQYKIIQFVAQCLGSHDLFTGRHVVHTQKYVEVIAKELKNKGFYTEKLTDRNIQLMQSAAILHDIGKIHIPEGVLNKIGKFTPQEFEIMKAHPEEGRRLLQFLPQIEGGLFNKIALDMCYCHHEKWNGKGYPNGLSGQEIPLSARIMAAADVLDALISQRLYKDPMTIDEAMAVFEESAGSHFEPCIAKAVIKCKPLIILIDNDFKNSEAISNAEELEWWKNYHEKLKKI